MNGLLVLAATGVVGIGLAIHGYGNGAVVGGGTAGLGGATSPAGLAKTSATSGPSRRGGGTATTSATPTTRPPASTPSSTSASSSPSTKAAPKLGPLFSSTSYSQYAYQVYPGQPSSQARLAMAGFAVRVTPGQGGLNVAVSVPGSTQAPQSASYPTGEHVYFVEASFGDDSGDADYNSGDDGLVVTNAQGRIIQ